MEKYISNLLKIKDGVKSSAPLIHCITNPIAINDCANAVLALGAKPIMAEHPLETAGITKLSGALCVNLGNITDVRLEGIGAAAQSANENGIPIIIDAVGVTCSKLRKDYCLSFIESYKPNIIKGNAAEIKSLVGESFSAKGIDSTETDIKSTAACERKLSQKTGAVVVTSGKDDIITNGNKTAIVSNGCEMMSLVTGTGCVLGTVIGTFMSSGQMFDSAVLGCGFFGLCGELADSTKGTATFRTTMMDNLYSLDNNTIYERIRVKYEA